MLVAWQCDIGRNPWFSSNLEALYNTESSRMPNAELLPTRPDWREQYSSFSLSEEQSSNSPRLPSCNFSNESLTIADQDGSRSLLEQQQTSLSKPGETAQPDQTIDGLQWDSSEASSPIKSIESSRSMLSQESPKLSLVSIGLNQLGSASRGSTQSVKLANEGEEPESEAKNEDEELDDDDDDDDDDMIDVEHEERLLPKTEAERRAERRKMKRFRLTHQQTRFLMSEFAKQAHPDAAHRERLSKEIPGLSPRQVQVWFQNRRAKIKRLTADDRDRMIKMRAVPENFDNIKALHSPYGAVHGLGSPLKTPAEFRPSYSEQLMSPLVIDSTNNNHETHISPTASSPAFSHLGFSPNSSLRSPDILSASTALTSPDRYYSPHMSSPLSAGPLGKMSFTRQSNAISPSQSCHPQGMVRALQPSQLRENVSKLKLDSLQSPLRLSMSWKGENLNYSDYHKTGQSSPQYSEQQSSLDQQHFRDSQEVDSQQYDTSTYSNTNNIEISPSNIFPTPHSANSFLGHSDFLSLSRIRATSTNNFPSSLDLRNQFQARNSSPLATPQGNSFGNNFTAGYVSAPQTSFINSQDFMNVSDSKLTAIGSEQIDDKLFGNTESVRRTEVGSPKQCQRQ